MNDDSLWLIFDIGTSGVKAALVGDEGNIVRSATVGYPTHSASGGVVEQDAGDWWRAVIESTRAVAPDPQDVRAIAVTGQMQDLVLADAFGEPLRPVILYSDTRAQVEASEVIDRMGRDSLIALTGNDQGADSLWAKLTWVQRYEPAAFERATYILFGSADYAVLKLTGRALTDTTTASTTGLLNLAERRWLDAEALETMGIGAAVAKLPTLVPGGAFGGDLLPEAAAALGLTAGIPVYHAPGDAGATTIGAGSGEIGHVYAYLGTSGWVAFSDARPGSPEQGVFTLAHPQLDRYIQVAPLLTAGGNLAWARGLFDAPDFESMIAQGLERPPSSVLYLPYLNGERAPFTDPLARAAFIGMSGGSERADLYRAVLEGVAFAYRHAIEALLPSGCAKLTLTGGGTRSERWCQLFADVLGIPIALAADAENVGVRGALLSAQVANGTLATYAPEGFFPVRGTLQPNPDLYERYSRKYALYLQAYPALKSLFASLAGE